MSISISSAEPVVTTRQDLQRANSRAAFKWGSLVIALLASQVAIGIAAIILASSDPSVAVVPGYHQKAILWDESVSLRESSRAMGWTVQHHLAASEGGHRLTWTIRNKEGEEVQNLHGRILLYHHAHARDAIIVPIEDHAEGISLDPPGIWQVEMTLTSGDSAERFFDLQIVDTKRAI